ncbi:MAG TPA: DUF2336 domain-containing protein [Xanthobacteraceae bacterium]|jgi:uncharacterized protein (DUF2336 family)|nr:DUF2336 domain-containing protein [Xanthobacteraceae bacterium]
MESASLAHLINLTRAGLRGGVDMRPTLLRVLTDLYVQKLTHTVDEERHYTELALRLLDAVDVPTRAAVAARLVRHLTPPVRIIEKLAADLPDVAAAVRADPRLQRRPQLSEAAAATIAADQAEITEIDEVQVPSSGEDRGTEFLTAQEPGLLPADMAGELNELFFAASADERRLILLNLEIATPMPSGRIGLQRDAAVGRRLEAAALARNREDFAQHLAQALQIPRVQARRIAGDELGEPIVVATKALATPRDVVYRILLFVNTTVGHSVERVHTLAGLYDEMTLSAAEHMVSIWQSLHSEQPLGNHRPLHWNDEARARARTATAAVRRAPSAHRPNDRRTAS